MEGTWTQGELAGLQAQLADAADSVDQLLFDVRLSGRVNGSLTDLRREIGLLFHHASDVVLQGFRCCGGLEGLLIYLKGMIDQNLMVRGILDRLVAADLAPADGLAPGFIDRVNKELATSGDGGIATQLGVIASMILEGRVILAFDGPRAVLGVKVDQVKTRAIAEPPSSPTVFGPREGFIENLETNMSLIRRRLRTPRLWVDERRLGTLTGTAVRVLHVHGVADDLLVEEMLRRLDGIRIDAVSGVDDVVELIRDAPASPMPTVMRTERPDRVVAGLVEGQVAILVDGSPFAALAPITVGRLMKADADHYSNWLVASFLRGIRFCALMLGLFLPALYVAIVTFHQEFIPTPLLITLAASRENVPLPSILEILLLLGIFEIIREAGSRVPKGIGNALTIGGTLVVGNAAVRAGIVSAPTIIITSAVVIAFFAIPNYDLVQVSRLIFYPILIASSILGVYGILFVFIGLFIYMASLRSFGTPYLAPFAPFLPRDWKDFMVRLPRWALDTRPASFHSINPRRQAPGQKPRPPRRSPRS